MIDIRPISDLRNHYNEIEQAVMGGSPVYLTKNGYGTMVVMSIEQYSELTDNIAALTETQKSYIDNELRQTSEIAKATNTRLSHNEVFDGIRKELNEL